jgi:SAM-dependent methyltransferase
MKALTAEAPPAGNVYDKHSTRNPFVRLLMRGFWAALDDLLSRARPRSLLAVGCGEGHELRHVLGRMPDLPVVGVDLSGAILGVARSGSPGARFAAADARLLPFADDILDTVLALEVLEHVPGPERALAEALRVARRWAVFSVPVEPLWRCLNLARGAYWRDLGNTPGHANHWSRRGFLDLLSTYARIEAVRCPLPWVMALCRPR